MKKKHVEYTIWLAWNKPIVGASFPPGYEKPFGYVNGESWKQLVNNGDKRLGDNVWAHIGDLNSYNAMIFYQKAHAEMWTSRIPGSYIEERESK